jgi:hypothetical protein
VCADRPEAAEDSLREALAGWPDDRYTTAHYRTASARLLMLLYRGRAADALALAESTLASMRSAMLHRVALLTGMIATFGALAAITVGDRARIRTMGAAIRRTRIPAMQGGTAYCRAALRAGVGDLDGARAHLTDAARIYDREGYTVFGYGARHRLGALVGSGAEAADARAVRAAVARVGVRAPDTLLDMLGPPLPVR